MYQGVDPSEFFPEPGFEVKHPAAAIIQNHTVYEKTLGLLKFRSVIEKSPDVNFYITTGENIRQSYFPLVKNSLGHCKNVHFVDWNKPPGWRKAAPDRVGPVRAGHRLRLLSHNRFGGLTYGETSSGKPVGRSARDHI